MGVRGARGLFLDTESHPVVCYRHLHDDVEMTSWSLPTPTPGAAAEAHSPTERHLPGQRPEGRFRPFRLFDAAMWASVLRAHDPMSDLTGHLTRR